jgi:uncharacterized protein (DUF302 family)
MNFNTYVILGACNPSLAYQSLQKAMNRGLLLPGNAIVWKTTQKEE